VDHQERTTKLAEIKALLEKGMLTCEQIRRAMRSEIDNELRKPAGEIDMEHVNACESLLEYLSKEKLKRAESHFEQNRTAIRKKLRRVSNPAGRRTMLRLALATVCLLMLFPLADVLLISRRVDTHYSSDQEQLIYEGTLVSNGLDRQAVADDIFTESIPRLDTLDLGEVISFLGFEPEQPAWVPAGWNLDKYTCFITNESKEFHVSYVNAAHEHDLTFEIDYFTKLESLRHEIEQNPVSGEIQEIGEKKVYFSSNMDDHFAIWYDDAYWAFLSGPISEKELIKIIESIP